MEDCHLWLYREKEALPVADPPGTQYCKTNSWYKSSSTYHRLNVFFNKIFMTTPNLVLRANSHRQELTRPLCQSSLSMHGRQKYCLPCPIRYDIFMLTNLDDKDGGSVVADPWGHLGQALVVRGRGVEEPPILPVLQQLVGVDEQDAGE